MVNEQSKPVCYFHHRERINAVGTPYNIRTVVCPNCRDKHINDGTFTAIYAENLGQYNQSCHYCKTVLHTGTFGTELYEKPHYTIIRRET